MDGFAVRVSDPQDVLLLRSNPAFSEVAELTERVPGKSKSYKVLSVEFYSKDFDVASIDEWKTIVWGLLKYRKPRK